MLTTEQVGNMTDPQYSWFGMTNAYNSMLLAHSEYYTKNYTMFE